MFSLTARSLRLVPSTCSRSLATTSVLRDPTSPFAELKRDSPTTSHSEAKKNEAKAKEDPKSEHGQTKAEKAANSTKYGTTEEKETPVTKGSDKGQQMKQASKQGE